jgi:hypothetical protein
MKRAISITFAILVVCLSVASLFSAGTSESGDWTMRKADQPGKVEFSLTHSSQGHHSQNSTEWPLSSFQGLDAATPGRHDVHFTITRDAGKFDCEGFLRDGEGAGIFHFTPNPQYPEQLAQPGFRGVDGEKKYELAVQDVSVAFARDMAGEHLHGLDTDKLIEFRIFGVDPQFIHALGDAGLSANESSRLVEFRIHGVTPEFARTIKARGYQADEEKLVELRIHGATPEFMDEMGKMGYSNLPLEKLVEFRIFNVTPDFIQKIEKLGYQHPDADRLVEMRIHGVTPEYIANMQSRGLKDLSLEKLVEMRGIIEPAAVMAAARRRTPEQLEAIAEALEAMEEAPDLKAWAEADLRFHEAVLMATSNELLGSLFAVIETALATFFVMSAQTARHFKYSLPHHRAVYEAIRRRRPNEAATAMRAMIADSRSNMRRGQRR